MFFLPFTQYWIREQPVIVGSGVRWVGRCVFLGFLVCLLAAGVHAAPVTTSTSPDPVVYLNMNEGSGQYLFDLSGNGNAGTIHNASRTGNGACSGGLQLGGLDEYVAIPYSSKNHPDTEITVDLWFAIYSYDRQVLISSYKDGGYRMAFDDGGDLWWTVSSSGGGDISVPIQHENIPPNQWHHVAGTYDGRTAKIYLDGILRNTVNASGPIHYTYKNYVMLGVDAGTVDQPDPQCNGYMKGGLDEVRIHNRALTYGEVMDDRFSCTQEPVPLTYEKTLRTLPAECTYISTSFALKGGEEMVHRVIVTDAQQQAVWHVQVPPDSTVAVDTKDAYSQVYPDAWYIEIDDGTTRLTRSVAFPNTINTPSEAAIPSGNATIIIRYFDGVNRFPSSAYVDVRCTAPPPPIQESLNPIFSNPIIVIYSASWATLIALVLVFFWLRRRNRGKVT
jgi:hypothetical protein